MMRKTLVGAVVACCVVSIAASCVLALSYTVFKGLTDLRPLVPALVFTLQGAVTLAALSAIVSALAIDVLAFAGAMGLVWVSYSMVQHTLSSPHFEGYALVLGTAGVLQGTLTLLLFLWRMLGGLTQDAKEALLERRGDTERSDVGLPTDAI